MSCTIEVDIEVTRDANLETSIFLKFQYDTRFADFDVTKNQFFQVSPKRFLNATFNNNYSTNDTESISKVGGIEAEYSSSFDVCGTNIPGLFISELRVDNTTVQVDTVQILTDENNP